MKDMLMRCFIAHPVELKTDATPVVDPQLVAEVNPPM